jgi:glycerophosphoryl diester phosphodiesterase
LCPNSNKILTIAHRGARSLAPENTLAAARRALEIGAEMWEVDVQMSADGELFLTHDETLCRTSNAEALFPDRGPWSVQRFRADEIRRLDCGSWFCAGDPFGQVACGEVTPEELDAFRGEPVPTLREALVFTRDNDWRINVELKDHTGTPGDATLVEQVVAIVDEVDVAGRVLLSSFNHRYLARVKEINSAIATGALVFEPVPEPVELLRTLDAAAYHPWSPIVVPEDVTSLREAGYDVFVWTVNDESEMRSLIRMGVSGIFTDFPQLLRRLLAEMEE